MKFNYKGNQGIEIQFESSDSIEELRVVEQGVSTLRNILQLIRASTIKVQGELGEKQDDS